MITKVTITMKNGAEFVSQIPAEYGGSLNDAYDFVANSKGLRLYHGWVIVTADNISSMVFSEE